MMLTYSLDTEVTGVDIYHGARPFFVSFCDTEWNNMYYEWEVDPLTRKVKVPKQDSEEVAHTILKAERLVLQNPKFDVSALLPVLPKGFVWPWHLTFDTLMAGHLLANNHPHDLTSMVLEYLGIDIAKYEKAMEKVVKECLKIVTRKGSPISNWRIAKSGLPEMPSAKEKTWKYDLWLPSAILQYWKKEWGTLPEGCEDAVSIYGNHDSTTTLALHLRQMELIEERGLMEIYLKRLELLPVIHSMEHRGVTLNKQRLDKQFADYKKESEKARQICVNIAETYGVELELPKSGNNKSLTTFAFETLKLPAIKRSQKTGAPSLDKTVIEEYLATLPERSKELLFVRNLTAMRKRATAMAYMEGYQKYWLPFNYPFPDFSAPIERVLEKATGVHKDNWEWFVLHPSLNATGTDTLRFSSNHPNEQNISKQEGFNLRYMFGPAPGREWWSLDAKNIELRIPAYESGEQEYIALFESENEPPYYGSVHLLNFHTIYPELWEPALKEVGIEKVGPYCKKKYAGTWYQWCKNFDFAVQYGAVEREAGEGTADKAAHKPGAHALVKQRFSKLEKLNQKYIDIANRLGYVETIPDKSVNPHHGYPLLCTRSEWGNIKPTVPLNYHVQGTAMWWMCQAMIRCQAWLDDHNRGRKPEEQAHLVMQVHDELVFDFPKSTTRPDGKPSNLSKVQELAKIMSTGGDDIGVPTPVGIEYNPENWAEGVTLG